LFAAARGFIEAPMDYETFCTQELSKLGDVLCINARSAWRRFNATGSHARSTRESMPTARSVAVIPIMGTLTEYGSWGTTSLAEISQQFDAAMRSSSVGSIVLAFDSPGGTVPGVPELAAKIRKSRNLGKQIVSVAASEAASAALWIATAAGKFYMQPSAEAGSLGVWAMHVDESKALEQEGLDVTLIVSEQSPRKVAAHPFAPLSNEDRNELQRRVNQTAEWFIEDMAKNRNVSTSTVRSRFGRGDMLRSEEAVAVGLSDGIAELGDVITRLRAGLPIRASTMRAAHIDSNDPATLRLRLQQRWG
jgi:ClpP class serine protease